MRLSRHCLIVATIAAATSFSQAEVNPVPLTLSGTGYINLTAMAGDQQDQQISNPGLTVSSAGSSSTQVAGTSASASYYTPDPFDPMGFGDFSFSSIDALLAIGESAGAGLYPHVQVVMHASSSTYSSYGSSPSGTVNPAKFTGNLAIGSNVAAGFPVGNYLTLKYQLQDDWGWWDVANSTADTYLSANNGQQHVVGMYTDDTLIVKAGQTLPVQMQVVANNHDEGYYSYTVTGSFEVVGTPWNLSPDSSYSGFGGTSDSGTQATIIDGTTGGDRAPTCAWADPSTLPVTNATTLGEVLELSGTFDDIIVLQMSYDLKEMYDKDIPELELALLWSDGAGNLLPASLGNTDGDPVEVQGAYDSSIHGLGSYGIDTENHVVWAVINHNSQFVVGAILVPEPTTLVLLAPLAVILTISRRSNRRDAI